MKDRLHAALERIEDDTWSWDDVDWTDFEDSVTDNDRADRLIHQTGRRGTRLPASAAPARPPPAAFARKAIVHGRQRRPHWGGLARFLGTSHHADRAAASLSSGHPAVLGARTLFPSSVVDADRAPRVLVDGHNSAKIGRTIRRGPWRGLRVYTLTLEERATCPAHCSLWRECYGNAMPFSRRHHPGPALIAAIGRDLALAMATHRRIAVRLHVLGDFYDAAYVRSWLGWMDALPGLHVFGFTAHRADGEVGRLLAGANARWPGRWAIRFSVSPDVGAGPLQATTIWRQPEAPRVAEGLVCPAQTGRTDACATCGLCWSPAMADTRIVFLAGQDAAAPMTRLEVVAQWKHALGTGPARLIDALLAHPEGLDREQLAALVHMSPTGGAFNAQLRALINHELAVPGRGKRLRLADILRPEEDHP